ncbi:MAG: hypothetical protein NTAFB09_06360 [Nitrosospira sp.]
MKKASAPDEKGTGGGGGPDAKGRSSGGSPASKGRSASTANTTNTAATVDTPDTSVLACYSPTEGAQSQPDWIKKKFPAYIAPHGMHDATSVRELTHNGHQVRIITTYRVEVDGEPVGMHLSVDEDGQVYTHATPFVTYASAVDLMKQVMDAYPGAFSDDAGDEAQSGHDQDHAHGQAGEGEQS